MQLWLLSLLKYSEMLFQIDNFQSFQQSLELLFQLLIDLEGNLLEQNQNDLENELSRIKMKQVTGQRKGRCPACLCSIPVLLLTLVLYMSFDILAQTFHLLGHFGTCTFRPHEHSSRWFTVSKSPKSDNLQYNMLVRWADGTNDLFGAESKCNVQVALPKFKFDQQSRQQVLKQ